ncbi:MGMT family protein [Candidatus Woesearchaeota archaeon]|nr:MGMT family protein [Candidatus Woesearchaeota archaeon]
MEEITFTEKVYALCRKIPRGKVTTYAEIARALDCNAYQAVGNALKSNPYAPVVPCHRVVKSNGRIGGFKGKTQGKAIHEKIKLLETEGVEIIGSKVNLAKHLFRF